MSRTKIKSNLKARKEEFMTLYFTEEKSLREAASIMGVEHSNIRYYARVHWKIKVRSREEAIQLASKKCKYTNFGEDNNNYKSGKGNRYGKYGITKEAFNEMLISQNRECAICKCNIDDSSHIDHCHSSGNVRGLLCRSCNHGLGNFKDSVNNLSNAIKYLYTNRK